MKLVFFRVGLLLWFPTLSAKVAERMGHPVWRRVCSRCGLSAAFFAALHDGFVEAVAEALGQEDMQLARQIQVPDLEGHPNDNGRSIRSPSSPPFYILKTSLLWK